MKRWGGVVPERIEREREARGISRKRKRNSRNKVMMEVHGVHPKAKKVRESPLIFIFFIFNRSEKQRI